MEESKRRINPVEHLEVISHDRANKTHGSIPVDTLVQFLHRDADRSRALLENRPGGGLAWRRPLPRRR
ncbi:hypothetical protein MRX96_025225 [Rhipicephalus microplus]